MENLITPTIDLMNSWFNEFNEQYFNNVLPKISLYIRDLGPHTWGQFTYTRGYNRRTRLWNEPLRISSCYITMNELFKGTEHNLKNTFIHEMLHYYITYTYKYHPTRFHGQEFLAEAKKINSISEWNITPTNDYCENALNDAGMEKYQTRIHDKYLIGVMNYKNECWAFVTNTNLMQKAYNYCITIFKQSPKFYEISVKNTRFALIPVARIGRYIRTFVTKPSEAEMWKEIDNQYGLISKKEYVFNDTCNTKEKCYLMVIYNKKYYWATKVKNVIDFKTVQKKYVSLTCELYDVKEYDEDFARMKYSTKKFNTAYYATNEKDFWMTVYKHIQLTTGRKMLM